VRRGLVLAMVAACGAQAPKRAEPVEPAVTIPPNPDPYGDGLVSAERPHVRVVDYVPDFHDELRWPLPAMSHPELEPQFPIARELAIDVGWEALCARGVHRRVVAAKAEQLEYLRGWCSVLERDIDAACRSLKPLMLSNLRGMPEAVRRDLANILVGHGDADAAEGYMTRNLIRDTRVMDLLAASYAEMGKHDDAYAINRLAIDADRSASAATKCLRLVRHIVLLPSTSGREFPLEQLRQFVADREKADSTCVKLFDAVTCWNKPGDQCRYHFSRNNINTNAVGVIEAYFAWPEKANYVEWWRLADSLRHMFDVPGAIDLALAAFEASLAAARPCVGYRASAVNGAIVEIRAFPSYAAYDARLQELARECPRPAVADP
jgi:hypothetical protein